MKDRLICAIVFGGRSAEHEISMLSANSVLQALDRDIYEPLLIYIKPEGTWHLWNGKSIADNLSQCKTNPTKLCGNTIALLHKGKNPSNVFDLEEKVFLPAIDVAFPVLHGPFGEDGTIQGMFKLLNIPFVGAGILGSAVGMDKEATKKLLEQAELPIARYRIIRSTEDIPSFDSLSKILGSPLFIKPANCGSSVGVHQVHSEKEYREGMQDAFLYDQKVLVEEKITGREIECSVLGNDEPKASIPGEIISHHDFYSYEAKYVDEKGASLSIPAKLDQQVIEKIQKLAIEAYKSLYCEGMARADFFLTPDNALYINELNTIPGFTSISMYSKLWIESGISYEKLVKILLELALNRFKKEEQLKTTFL